MAPCNVNLLTFGNALAFLTVLLDSTAIVADESTAFRKCCNPGSVLTFDGDSYFCESAPPQAADFYQGTSGQGGFPLCRNGTSDLTAIPFAQVNPLDFPRDFCIDLLLHNSTDHFDEEEEEEEENHPDEVLPTILYCSNSEPLVSTEKHIPTLMKVRRCCARGETFKIKDRACLPSENLEEVVLPVSMIRNAESYDFIYAVRGPPKCQHAIVDYEVNFTDVSIVAGRLQVTASNSYDVVDLLATEDSACLDVGEFPGLLVVRTCRGVEYCRNNVCLRKCCPEDEALFINKCQKLPSNMTLARWHDEVWELPKTTANVTEEIINTTEYGLLVGNPCKYGMYPVLRYEEWNIVPEGKLFVPGYKVYEHHEHCTDMFYNTSIGKDDFYPFVCFEDPPLEENTSTTSLKVKATLLLISCAFLFVTLLVYICLPALQNLHGKTLMCHVGSLFLSYVCLTIVSIATPSFSQFKSTDSNLSIDSEVFCSILGYLMLFFLSSTFFWLNVLCFDIWWKFGSLRHAGRTNTKRRDEQKRFIFYCVYAWGLGMSITLFAVAADSLKFLPGYFLPGIGVHRCWFASDRRLYGELIFFIGPVTVQLLVNLVFFILTARRCSMVKAEIQRRIKVDRSDPRSRRFQADRTKLILNVKLFVVMGISWIFEIISYFLNTYITDFRWKQEFFYLADVLNCLQGFLIFALFVLKKKVFHALRRKFGKGSKRRASTGGIHDPYRVRKSPSSSTILSTFAVSSSP